MAHHDAGKFHDPNERLTFGTRAGKFYQLGLGVGIAGILLAVFLGYFVDHSFRRFFFAYLVSFAFFLSLSVGGLLFVLIQFVTRAGWSVAVRRIPETMACASWVLFVLSAPILGSVMMNNGSLYRWAQPIAHHGEEAHGTTPAHGDGSHTEAAAHGATAPATQAHGDAAHADTAHAAAPAHGDAAGHGGDHGSIGRTASEDQAIAEQNSVSLQTESRPARGDEVVNFSTIEPKGHAIGKKAAWLNPWFFIVRIIAYFAVFAVTGWWYWRRSVDQDTSGDDAITHKLQAPSAPLFLLGMLTVTFASIDLFMTLDPAWYSTMFPLIYFAGCAVGCFASMIVIAHMLQRAGFLTTSISTEHYHDLGKFLFAFTFFWGYVSFSQYMLIWYANLPEETGWMIRRGTSTSPGLANGFTAWSIALLVGHLLIPFAGLLSRHVKRNNTTLVFWACWLLVFHYVDLYWQIMPELDGHPHFGLVEILCFLGIGGVWVATLVRTAARHALRPTQDPRLIESLAFRNI